MKENIIQNKSFNFAKSIVYLSQDLRKKGEFEIASQILRFGTSIGANVEEGIGGQSTKDFLYKISIAYKEARETSFWIRLLNEINIIHSEKANTIHNECLELIKFWLQFKKLQSRICNS